VSSCYRSSLIERAQHEPYLTEKVGQKGTALGLDTHKFGICPGLTLLKVIGQHTLILLQVISENPLIIIKSVVKINLLIFNCA